MTDFLNFIWDYYPWGVAVTGLFVAFLFDYSENSVPENRGPILTCAIAWPLFWTIIFPVALGKQISTWLKNR